MSLPLINVVGCDDKARQRWMNGASRVGSTGPLRSPLKGLCVGDELTRRLFLESVIFSNFWPVSCTQPPPLWKKKKKAGHLNVVPTQPQPPSGNGLVSIRRKHGGKRFIDGAALPNLLLITPAKCITNRWHLFQYNLIPPALCHNLFTAAVHFYAICLTNFIIFASHSLDVCNEAVLFAFKYCWV